jgi:hypothetical protein
LEGHHFPCGDATIFGENGMKINAFADARRISNWFSKGMCQVRKKLDWLEATDNDCECHRANDKRDECSDHAHHEADGFASARVEPRTICTDAGAESGRRDLPK